MYHIIIPARLGSTRLAQKPLQDVGGAPMVVRVAEKARQSQAAEIWVATDHPSIEQVVRQAGFQAILTSPDHVNGSERLAEAVRLLRWPDDTIVVNVQGDEPFMEGGLMDAVAHRLAQDQDLPTATVAVPLDDAEHFFNPSMVKVVCDHLHRALYFSRAPIPWARDAFAATRTQLPQTLGALRHLGLYGYRAGALKRYPSLAPSPMESLESLEQLRWLWHGLPMGVVVDRRAPEPGIDTPEDLARARNYFSQQTIKKAVG